MTNESPIDGLLATSVVVSLMIAVFLAVRPLLRRAMGSQWLCVLWVLLLMRLLLPWPVETRWGLMGGWEGAAEATGVEDGPMKVRVSFPADKPETQGGAIDVAAGAATGAAAHATAAGMDWPVLVWLCGCAAALAALGWRGIEARRLAGQTRAATDERLVGIFASIPGRWRRRVELRTSNAVDVPTLSGIIRPQVWMPEGWLGEFSDEELRAILLHELGHARRGDLAVQWLFAIAQCLHWYNPLVWLAGRAARLDREMACDAWVLKGDLPSPAYGATLLKTAQLPRTPVYAPAGRVAMASGRQSLRARIAEIGGYRPARVWPGVVGMVAMIAGLGIGTTSRTTNGQTAGGAAGSGTAGQATPAAAALPEASAAAPAGGAANAANAANSANSASAGGPEIKVEAKFMDIEGDAWTKMRAEDAEFREETATFGNLDEAAEGYGALSGTAPDAAQLAALKALGWDRWVLEDGSWQNVSPLRGVTVLFEKPLQRMLRYLDGREGVDLVSAPRVTMRPGNRARLEIVREYRYATKFEVYKRAPGGWSPTTFRTQDIGVSLEVTGTLEASGSMAKTIGLDLNPEVVAFVGFLPEKNGGKIAVGRMHTTRGYWRPIFSILRGRTELNLLPNQTVMLAGVRLVRKSDRVNFEEPPKKVNEPDSTERRVMVVLVTASMVTPQGAPVAAGKLPYAIAAPGKPGFVTTPYAPDGEIDARGFSKGDRIKDPNTGRVLLMP